MKKLNKMIKQDTTQGNKLITWFMTNKKTGKLYIPGMVCSSFPKAKCINDLWDNDLAGYIKYHKSWDWLVPVIKKTIIMNKTI